MLSSFLLASGIVVYVLLSRRYKKHLVMLEDRIYSLKHENISLSTRLDILKDQYRSLLNDKQAK
jgi:hypothetical protein